MKPLTVQTTEHRAKLSALHTARHAARIKVTPEQIAEVFKLRAAGIYSVQIGQKLGLTTHTTRKILKRATLSLRPGPSEP